MKRILFVEDDALIARVYTQKLLQAGYEVSVAEDGLAAMKRLLEAVPDLVILDLMMPKLSGVDVLKFMRGNPLLKATRVVVFSNSFLGGLIEQVGSTGVEKVLIKSSATPSELLDAVREVLEGPLHPYRDPPLAPAIPRPLLPGALDAPGARPVAASSPGASGSQKKPEGAPKRERERMRAEFRKNGALALAGLRDLCRSFVDASDLPQRAARLQEMHRKTGFLTQMAAAAEFRRVAQLADALEALTFQLQEEPKLINDSTEHTIASTVALLTDLLERMDEPEEAQLAAKPTVLVVDNDAVSNRALVLALSRIHLQAVSVTDPAEALKKLQEGPFDLVLLDINMPGMDGLALCEKLRALPQHRWTPVVFVTSSTDMKTRARSRLSGGNDYITKPVLPVELCVKAVTHLMAKPS